jgi:plasmid stabilization system protein ParE
VASVRWSNRALADIRSIRVYLEENASEIVSERLSNAITESTKRLSIFPHMGRVVPEYEDAEFREVISGNYRVTYLTQDFESVFIVAIIHGRRNLRIALGVDPRRVV